MNGANQQELLFKENVLLNEINKTKINILDINTSFDILLEKRKSLSRFGDGEVTIILGGHTGFQKFDQNLSNRLREILYNNQDFCHIDIPDELNGLNNRTSLEKEYWINYLYSRRKKWLELLNFEKIYLNSNISRPYYDFLIKVIVNHILKLLKNYGTIKMSYFVKANSQEWELIMIYCLIVNLLKGFYVLIRKLLLNMMKFSIN